MALESDPDSGINSGLAKVTSMKRAPTTEYTTKQALETIGINREQDWLQDIKISNE